MKIVSSLIYFLVCVCLVGFASRRLRKKETLEITPDLLGNGNIVPNITVFGAIIMSDAGKQITSATSAGTNEIKSDGHTASELAEMRLIHARQQMQLYPFPLVEWPAVFTRPCPQNRHGHKTEHGLALAHYQIWLDFIYFDRDVLQALERMEVKEEGYRSTTFTSTGGEFMAYPNGSLYKNGIPFRDDDILVVLEDDAEIAIVGANTTLIEEFATMNTDLLFLGWCDGRAARPVPLCAHAYALTRKGARKLVHYFEPCGMAVDEQFVILGKNHWLTYRTAHPWSYEKNYISTYPVSGDHTKGIIHQKRIGSLNGH